MKITAVDIERAVGEMHRALALPIDLISTKRMFQPGPGRTMRPMNRFHFIAGALAVAAFDVFTRELVGGTRAIPFQYDKVRDRFAKANLHSNITGEWEARARVRAPGAKLGHWRWVTYNSGKKIREYMVAAEDARNATSHGGSAAAILVPHTERGLNLMWAEGLIQFVQDLAYCTNWISPSAPISTTHVLQKTPQPNSAPGQPSNVHRYIFAAITNTNSPTENTT
jgi:hypothetical protein